MEIEIPRCTSFDHIPWLDTSNKIQAHLVKIIENIQFACIDITRSMML